MSPRRKVVAVDFDGVIAKYDVWRGIGQYGEIIGGAAEAINYLYGAGWTVIIFTARRHADRVIMRDWLYRHEISYDELTNVKPTDAHVIVDDRGLTFNGDWDRTLRDILAFDPYYYRPEAFSDSGSGSGTQIYVVTRVHKEATNDKMNKLADEIRWIKGLPEAWRDHFPEIVLTSFDSNVTSYEMPHYTIPSMRRLIISGVFDSPAVLAWTRRILEFAFEMYESELVPLPDKYMEYMYFERAWRRLEEAGEKSPVLSELILRPEVVINGQPYPNLPEMLDQIARGVNKFLPEYVSRWGHADLHFSNILIDISADTFRLVDPRGYSETDYYYDFGKLWHSARSKYEMIAEGMFELDGDQFHLTDNNTKQVLNEVERELPHLLFQFTGEPFDDMVRKMRFANAMHFAAIAPFLMVFDGIEEKAIAGYYTGVQECCWLIQDYLT